MVVAISHRNEPKERKNSHPKSHSQDDRWSHSGECSQTPCSDCKHTWTWLELNGRRLHRLSCKTLSLSRQCAADTSPCQQTPSGSSLRTGRLAVRHARTGRRTRARGHSPSAAPRGGLRPLPPGSRPRSLEGGLQRPWTPAAPRVGLLKQWPQLVPRKGAATSQTQLSWGSSLRRPSKAGRTPPFLQRLLDLNLHIRKMKTVVIPRDISVSDHELLTALVILGRLSKPPRCSLPICRLGIRTVPKPQSCGEDETK